MPAPPNSMSRPSSPLSQSSPPRAPFKMSLPPPAMMRSLPVLSMSASARFESAPAVIVLPKSSNRTWTPGTLGSKSTGFKSPVMVRVVTGVVRAWPSRMPKSPSLKSLRVKPPSASSVIFTIRSVSDFSKVNLPSALLHFVSDSLMLASAMMVLLGAGLSFHTYRSTPLPSTSRMVSAPSLPERMPA